MGFDKLRALKEVASAEGKDRLQGELEVLSQGELRQVSQAAKLPTQIKGVSLTRFELQSALLAALIPSEEQEEAGWGQM